MNDGPRDLQHPNVGPSRARWQGLRRTGSDGVQRVTILNYKALADGAVTNDIELRDGDVILVPERRLFE